MIKRKILFLLTVLILLVDAKAYIYYQVDVSYNEGEIEVKNIKAVYSRTEKANYLDKNSKNVYKAGFYDKDKKLLNNSFFSAENIAYKEYGESGKINNKEIVHFNRSEFTLYFKYEEKAHELKIEKLDNESKTITKDIFTFSKTRKKEETKAEKADEKDKENYLLLIILMLLITAAIYFYLITKKREKHQEKKGS